MHKELSVKDKKKLFNPSFLISSCGSMTAAAATATTAAAVINDSCTRRINKAFSMLKEKKKWILESLVVGVMCVM